MIYEECIGVWNPDKYSIVLFLISKLRLSEAISSICNSIHLGTVQDKSSSMELFIRALYTLSCLAALILLSRSAPSAIYLLFSVALTHIDSLLQKKSYVMIPLCTHYREGLGWDESLNGEALSHFT